MKERVSKKRTERMRVCLCNNEKRQTMSPIGLQQREDGSNDHAFAFSSSNTHR
jgi:hypothetical protein